MDHGLALCGINKTRFSSTPDSHHWSWCLPHLQKLWVPYYGRVWNQKPWFSISKTHQKPSKMESPIKNPGFPPSYFIIWTSMVPQTSAIPNRPPNGRFTKGHCYNTITRLGYGVLKKLSGFRSIHSKSRFFQMWQLKINLVFPMICPSERNLHLVRGFSSHVL